MNAMLLSAEFMVELDAIDSALAGGVGPRIAQLDAELDALRPRLEAAQAEGMPELAERLESMIATRQVHLRSLAGYQELVRSGIKPASSSRTPVPLTPAAVVVRRRSRPPLIVDREPAPRQSIVEAMPLAVVEAPVHAAKPLMTRVQFARLEASFGARERAFWQDSGWSAMREAKLKSLVCENRGLLEVGHAIGTDSSNLRTSLRMLRDEFNERSNFGQFFGFNETRHHPYTTWKELSEGFELLGVAYDVMQWIEAHDVPADDRTRLLLQCGAAEAWVHRLNDENTLGFTDDIQRDVHRRVEALSGELYVPWWLSHGEGRIPTSEVVREARHLTTSYADAKRRSESADLKDKTIQTLAQLAASIGDKGDLDATIVPSVRACLEAGVPPSRKDLIALCLPYRAALREVDEKPFAKLCDYLAREEAKMAARHELPVDPEELPVEELNEILDTVRGYLKGKTLLFVGGRRIPEKKKDIEQALGLKELLWPDADPDTLIREFTVHMARADLVCHLIRWSRHSYKQVIDLAKSEGKETVVLKAGLGVNRLVNDVYEQVISRMCASVL